ncbi:MAG: nucleotidyltransferase family protein [Coprococcus sp.]|nr:nucleotidyltransferase family protein [Coprococcus sp.]
MKITGIIAEYNPFHNGHLYHIKKALERTGSDAAVVVMSGNFVQRGAPAIIPKHLRAEMALKGGAAAVLELPVCFSCGSAELFAMGAVSLLDSLGCVGSLCFGSECGSIEELSQAASILSKEPEDFKRLLRSYLQKGCSFPAARRMALADYTKDSRMAQLLDTPNNALGIEYLKALSRVKSPIRPYTIARCGAGHHEKGRSGRFSSASSIRTQIAEVTRTKFVSDRAWETLSFQVPSFCMPVLKESWQIRYPICAHDLSLPLRYKLLSQTRDSLLLYADMTPDLANRIMNRLDEFQDWDTFSAALKTKEITYTRISRVLLHILLDIRKDDLDAYAGNGMAQYARLLGFSQKSKWVLQRFKLCSRIPLVMNPARPDTVSDLGKRMLKTDCFAADLYESTAAFKFHRPFLNECRQEIRIL